MFNDFLILMKFEWLVTVIIFVLLFIKLGSNMSNDRLLLIIQLLLLANAIAGFVYNTAGNLFGDMFHTNDLVAFQKAILNAGVFMISLLFAGWLKKTEHLPEFFILLLSALLGMFLMISSGNLLIFYLSLELATIPVAAIANFDLLKRTSSESAMKMILSSALSSGILLFGISLIYGITGSISFAQIPVLLAGSPLQTLAFIFLFTAFAFKLSIVPFHLWTADVYEGAPMAVSAFLSVISKGAVSFIFISALYHVFEPMTETWSRLIVILSVITIVIGNLFALRQQQIKRFLAFSSIAQVGFILIGVSNGTSVGTASVVYFVVVYIFSNLAAFGVAAAISAATGKETIASYKGLYQENRFLSWMLALAFFSLAGIPPTAGFFGKLFLLSAGASTGTYWLITVAALNMMIALYYYLRVIRSVFMEKADIPAEKIIIDHSVKIGLAICAIVIVGVGFFGWIYDYIITIASR